MVVSPMKDWTCSSCGGTGELLIMDDPGPVCMACAEMDHLVFLPSGDAALTRRARQGSGLSAVVVRFSRSRGRYERQGVLVEQAALDQAEAECLADEPARARRRERDAERRAGEDLKLQGRDGRRDRRSCIPDARLSARRRSPGMPRPRQWTCRTVCRWPCTRAASLELAVIASVRHQDTRYDELLMSGVDRAEAREQVRDTVDEHPGWLANRLSRAASGSGRGFICASCRGGGGREAVSPGFRSEELVGEAGWLGRACRAGGVCPVAGGPRRVLAERSRGLRGPFAGSSLAPGRSPQAARYTRRRSARENGSTQKAAARVVYSSFARTRSVASVRMVPWSKAR